MLYIGILRRWNDMFYDLAPLASEAPVGRGVLKGGGPIAPEEIEAIDSF